MRSPPYSCKRGNYISHRITFFNEEINVPAIKPVIQDYAQKSNPTHLRNFVVSYSYPLNSHRRPSTSIKNHDLRFRRREI